MVGRHRQRARGVARRRHRCEYERSPRRAESPPRRGRERCGRCTGGSSQVQSCAALALQSGPSEPAWTRTYTHTKSASRAPRRCAGLKMQFGLVAASASRPDSRSDRCRGDATLRHTKAVDSAARSRLLPKKLSTPRRRCPKQPQPPQTKRRARRRTSHKKCARPPPRARGSTRRRRRRRD